MAKSAAAGSGLLLRETSHVSTSSVFLRLGPSVPVPAAYASCSVNEVVLSCYIVQFFSLVAVYLAGDAIFFILTGSMNQKIG